MVFFLIDTFDAATTVVYRAVEARAPTVRQALEEVQSLKLHQYKIAMVLSTILIKNKVFLHYKMVFNEILNHNLYLFVLTLS